MLLNQSTEQTKKVELENTNLKSSLDELKTQNQVAEEKIKILNTVVEQRYFFVGNGSSEMGYFLAPNAYLNIKSNYPVYFQKQCG